MPGAETVFGAASLGGAGSKFGDEAAVNALLDVLEAGDVKKLDTAQGYGNSEEYLGKVHASARFTIDSKFSGGFKPGSAKKEAVIQAAEETIQKTGAKKLDVYYIHAPDPETPISETLAGLQEVYKAGHFARLGLSNFEAHDVRKVYEHCKTNGYVLPTVYQGNYNPVARLQESVLFPTLRELGIAFYAYSPLAGGFLTKTKQQVLDGAGRFNPETFLGKMYSDLYSKPSLLEALAKWEAIANEAGCPRAELAYRWVKYNSPLSEKYGDGIIIGASSNEQLEETLTGLKNGPLDKKACAAIDDIWETIKHEAPLDNYNSFMRAK